MVTLERLEAMDMDDDTEAERIAAVAKAWYEGNVAAETGRLERQGMAPEEARRRAKQNVFEEANRKILELTEARRQRREYEKKITAALTS